jgi:malonyl-CoA/methylmalonyl-CoA synthetase
VPLALSHPRPELEYVIDDTGAQIIVAHDELFDRVRYIAESRNIRLLSVKSLLECPETEMPHVDENRRAMIIYTSGTTGRPKGVVTTHRNITASITTLIHAWEWSSEDFILNVLPLHHVHGIINIVSCALWSGARCEFMPKFDADRVWERLAQGDLTLFMAVPTIYSKLIQAWEDKAPDHRDALSRGAAKLRLMVSGSAALPVPVLETWERITGHRLLERYGMTEIGMALSNPLHAERKPGHVGMPLPNVQVRLIDESGEPAQAGTPGEIQVKGPSVFLEYWNRPEETRKAFQEGWFRTGDIAILRQGSYAILGRSGADIIKTGGYKVSALEIENILLEHPDVREASVVGVDDPTWGQVVCAALVMAPESVLTPESLRDWAKERLASYKAPSRILFLSKLPRNSMGKVEKPRLALMF